MSQTKNTIEVKPYLTNELAKIYQVSDKTLKKWLKVLEEKLGTRMGRYYTAKQVEIIFNELGIPKTLEA